MEVATVEVTGLSTSYELLPVADMAVDEAFLTSRTRREEAREANVIRGSKRNEVLLKQDRAI